MGGGLTTGFMSLSFHQKVKQIKETKYKYMLKE